MPARPPSSQSAPLAAGAAAAGVFLLAAGITIANTPDPSFTADSGMMAGLLPLAQWLRAIAVLIGAAMCAAVATTATAVADARKQPWLALATVAIASLLLACVLGAMHLEWREGVLAARWGAGPMLAGVAVGALVQRWHRRRPGATRAFATSAIASHPAAPRALRAIGDTLDDGLARWVGRADGRSRLRAVGERRALLLLVFVGFSGFALFACLAIPDVAPWYFPLGHTGGFVNRLLHYGSQPWLRLGGRLLSADAALAQAWITAIAFGTNATVLAALVFAARARGTS